MSQPRTLTIVTPTFHPELIGTPHYATDAAQWFAEQGWRVRVLTAQPFYPEFRRHPGYGRRTRRERLGDIEIVRVPTIVPKGGRPLWRAVNEANFALQAQLRVRRLRSDAVLTISPGTPWICWPASRARRPGGRHVVLVHDIQHGLAETLGTHRIVSRVLGMIERRALGRADAVAVLTDEMGEALRDLGVERPITVVPIWATVPEPTDALLATTDRTVQYSGNFGSKQGLEVLTALARALHAADPSVRLVLRGAGARYDALAGEIRAAGLDNVAFEAPVATDQLPTVLARSPIHIAVQAATTAPYAMPSKVVNALASGARVLVLTEGHAALARLAEVVEGLELHAPSAAGNAARRIAELLDDVDRPAWRRSVATAAAKRFSRADRLDDLLGLLEGAPS